VTSASLLCSVDRNKYQIQIPLPPKIDPTVTMMTVEEKPDVTYSDIGGCKEQIEKMREVVELPMLHPEKFVQLGIDPPKGVLCYGPPGEWTPPTKTAPDSTLRITCEAKGGARNELHCRCMSASSALLHACHVWQEVNVEMPAPRVHLLQGHAWQDAHDWLLHAQHPKVCGCGRDRQNAAGASSGQPHGRLLHQGHRQRAGAEVCGRGRSHGQRTLPGASPLPSQPQQQVWIGGLHAVGRAERGHLHILLASVLLSNEGLWCGAYAWSPVIRAGVCVQMARSKKACLVFFDEIDAIGGARFDDGAGEPGLALCL
jgi:hypothetical protein